jgi:hypothetical protein
MRKRDGWGSQSMVPSPMNANQGFLKGMQVPEGMQHPTKTLHNSRKNLPQDELRRLL